MAWIESHTVLSRHRKLRELSRGLRLRPVYTMGHLHALWHTVLEQQEDGNLGKWSDALIADSSDYPGDAPQYVRLLQQHGWLDDRLIHDWLDYAGSYLMSKYASNNREKLIRIWTLHGKQYGCGKRMASEWQVNGKSNLTLPNLPNQQNNAPAPSVAAVSLAQRLAFLMRENDPKAKVPESLDKWSLEADRIFKLDERLPDEAGKVLEWCQSNTFWRSNILSMDKFRKQYPKLLLQMQTPKNIVQEKIVGQAIPVPGKYAHLGDGK